MKKQKITAPQVEEDRQPEVKLKRVESKRYYVMGLGAFIICLGLLAGFMYYRDTQVLYAAVTVLMLPIGGWLIMTGYQMSDGGVVITQKGQKVDVKSFNSIIIYGKKKSDGTVVNDRIEFANLDNPEGTYWKCRNNRRYYYVYVFDPLIQKMRPFEMPDNQFFAPELLYGAIRMDAVKDWAKPRPNGIQMVIKWGAMLAALGIGAVILLALGG